MWVLYGGNSGGPIQWDYFPKRKKNFRLSIYVENQIPKLKLGEKNYMRNTGYTKIHLFYTKLHASVVVAWLFLVGEKLFVF